MYFIIISNQETGRDSSDTLPLLDQPVRKSVIARISDPLEKRMGKREEEDEVIIAPPSTHFFETKYEWPVSSPLVIPYPSPKREM